MGDKRPLILVTNDDGVLSDGIDKLAAALESVGEVIVVAPSRQQSAVSHAITIHSPLRLRSLAPNRYAVTGTPADAVLLGLARVCPRKPDLIVSGINHGPNLASDVFYSGTVAGAVEGALNGIPAVAVSQELPSSEYIERETSEQTQKMGVWDPLAHMSQPLAELLERTANFTAKLIAQLLTDPLPADVVLNVNAPSCPTEKFRWTRVSRHAQRRSRIVQSKDPRGLPYYWLAEELAGNAAPDDSDLKALEDGVISLTPVTLELTAKLEKVPQWRVDGFSGR